MQPLVPISSVSVLVNEMRAGRSVIVVDEEGRENEGDIILAADYVTPQAINFMVTHARGLVCLSLSRQICERLQLHPMTMRNGTRHGTAFTVSIEAAKGVSTGISASDRAHTISVAVAPNSKASDLVQPGHIFPLQASDGGVLIRAGHTEAGCDLAIMAGCSAAAVICEILNEDGTMARLPDLQRFAHRHNLKIGTIADLIEYRSRTESLVKCIHTQSISNVYGDFILHSYMDTPSKGVHFALVKGQVDVNCPTPVRVHEPLSVLDFLQDGNDTHSWGLNESLQYIKAQSCGVIVLLNCGESAESLIAQMTGKLHTENAFNSKNIDLRNYGIGAQILRDCGVRRMHLMSHPRNMPNMTGYGLEVCSYINHLPSN